MAVEVNKRKRKHKTPENEKDAGDEAIPKKQAKTTTPSPAKKEKKAKKKRHGAPAEQKQTEPAQGDEEMTEEPVEAVENDQQEGEGEANEDSGYEEKPMHFPNDFKMMEFRGKLRGNNFITELRHFLYLSESLRPKIIAKYIEKRGKPLEFVEALERIDKGNVLHVGYVCQALQLVLMEILGNQKSHMESAVSASRFFLKAHGAVLESLLKSSQLKHRRIALKLMTAFVCIEPQLGRQLLSSYEVLTHEKSIANFLYHSRHEIHQDDTVRKCFIHFVLAYMVDGNTLLIRNILDRGAVIRALVAGLIYDDHVTVCVVLSTLKKYVLECADISKTKKIHVFDLNCCKQLARLYDWLGPKVFAAQQGGGGGKEKVKLPPHQLSSLVNPQELEAVATSVHEFLELLLTSRKYGITFDAITHLRQKHNSVQGKIIGYLSQPHLNPLKTELVIKILKACPDLARSTMRHYAAIIKPTISRHEDTIRSADFLASIITTLHPKLLQSALDKLTLTDLAYWVKEICLPLQSLAIIRTTSVLTHERADVRVAYNRLLLAMFTQYSNFMTVIARREQSKGGNAMRRFKFDVLNHIMGNFPTVNGILASLFKTSKTGDLVLEHLEVTLDLLLVICKEHRQFVNKTNLVLDYLDLLRPLYAGDDEEGGASKENIKIEMKAIKTILLLNPGALKPTENLFSGVLKSFLKAFVYGEFEVSQEAGRLLREIFRTTNIFDSGLLEIDLWLEALRFVDEEAVEVVTAVFLEVLQVTTAEVERPKTEETLTSVQNLHQLFQNIEKGLSVQAYVETFAISKLMPLIFKGVEIVGPLQNYLEIVSLLMFLYYPKPNQVMALYDMELSEQHKYMSHWCLASTKKTPKLEGAIAGSIPHLQQVQLAILDGSCSFVEVFQVSKEDSQSCELEYEGKIVHFHQNVRKDRLMMIYIQMVFFTVAQLVEKQLLQREQAERAADFITSCVDVVHQWERKAEQSQENAIDVPESFVNEILKYLYSVRMSYVHGADMFSSYSSSYVNYYAFLRRLTEKCNKMDNFAAYSSNYRKKVVKSVAISLNDVEATIAASDQLQESLLLMQAFNLTAEDCTEILELLADKLKYTDFFVAGDFQQKSVYYELLVLTLRRLASLKNAGKCEQFIGKFSKYYTQFVKKSGGELNIDPLEEAFYDFLLVGHQYIQQLDRKFFGAMFMERKLTKPCIKLACLLLERDERLNEEFLRLLPENTDKKELIYPLMAVAFKKGLTLEPKLMQTLYQAFKNGFMKTIEKPQKAGVIYKENVESSVALIEACMPNSECVDFCQKNFKFDSIETFQMRLIEAIYTKAFKSLDEKTAKQKPVIFANFINVQVNMMSVDLRKPLSEVNKMELFGHSLAEWFRLQQDFEVDFTKIVKSQNWLNFCRSCLKMGMHVNESTHEGERELQQGDAMNGLLLRVMAFLVDRIFVDFTAENEEFVESPELMQLYEMICTHSKFFDIVLSQRASEVKTEILHLMFTLAKKAPSVLANDQIPVILGAYQATLSRADRYALALLQLFEVYECGLEQYRPFIWGESAIAFYALRAADEERTKLTQQETNIAQVMSLIDRHMCEYTINNFPIWRKLNFLRDQMPAVEFPDPRKKSFAFGSNHLERCIEMAAEKEANLSLDENDLRLCPKRDGLYEQCYDPAFMVPLMSMCFAPESYVHAARPVQNGLLALVFTALSAQDKDMRLAAACTQMRYRQHFEQSKFFEKPLWLQTYDNIQAGLSDLRDSWMKHKKNSGTPRVPLISALFVAKTLNLTTDPTHLLYKQLTMYLRLKSSFNFQCVPEFNVLFYSPEVEHQEFRQFIVEVIRQGIKSSSDLFLLVTTNTFKVLMGYYGSAMTTLEMNLLILSVFSSCVKIPASAKIMIEHVGILPWLSALIASVEFHQFDVLDGLVSILSNLWYSLRAAAKEFHNYTHLTAEVHRLLGALMSHLSPRLSTATWSRYLNILQKTADGRHYLAVTSSQLDTLVGCVDKVFPDSVQAVTSIKRLGSFGAESREAFCERLSEAEVDKVAIQAVASLREYVIGWRRKRDEEGLEVPKVEGEEHEEESL